MKIGLALSGGGVRSATHIGVLRALEEKGIKPSLISGASAGSIVAALYAMGYSTDNMEEIFLNLGKKLIDFDIKGFLKFFGGMVVKKNVKIDGLVRGNKIEELIKQLALYMGVEDISDVKIPLGISSVDINTSDLVMFTSKRLYDNRIVYNNKVKIWEAVRASISFPFIIKPKIIDNRRLVDGGVIDNVPVKVLRKMGANKVIAVNLGYCGEHHQDIDNIFEILNQSIEIMEYSISKNNSNEIDYLLKPRIYNVRLLDIDRIKECIDRGYRFTRTVIPDLRHKLRI